MIDRRTARGDAGGPRRRSGGLVVLLLLLAVFSGGLTYGLYRALAGGAIAEYDALGAHGVRASGTVVDADDAAPVVPFLQGGGTVVYRFSAGDKVFEGRGQSGPPNPPASRLGPGQVLQVTYDQRDPTRSCLCDGIGGRAHRIALHRATGCRVKSFRQLARRLPCPLGSVGRESKSGLRT